ncbi:Clavaminate synthase-like protein [Gloeophyllum trabeum ATCC 11539]|uniref:Clavaminate synthase-like protein n=1 Tax=Gloeophyllum trabeum (strain ATCC 11539 / FP-39264 / Madison 617) TaxID=670483 RepID=S7RIY7_GLOTA|nr:Clavaminate synthase-like protein [Gloeophyllum trabeum ATCC 11539]EPQ52574.1 Clavaminate synthase-like protein [Gloeophyllum trabeum ATCC 11539]
MTDNTATGSPSSYTGESSWAPSEPKATLDRLSPSIPPSDFLSSHVLKRKPAVFTSHLTDASWSASQHWTDLEYLRSKAGEVEVKVERLDTRTGGFGSGLPRIKMPFGEFLEKLQSGCEMYLTTQYDDEEEGEGSGEETLPEPFTCPPPCKCLKDDFPLRPSLLHSLVPHQVNLWLGRSQPPPSSGSQNRRATQGEIDWTQSRSSGLHHDHHDNLYVLLAGYKRFVLFPPSAHPHLFFYGSDAQVHENGVVSYEGAMGSDALSERERWGWEVRRLQGVVAGLKKQRKKEKAAEKAKGALGGKFKLKGIGKKKTPLEEELEAAESALVDAEDKYLDAIGDEGLEFGGEGMRDDFDALGDMLGGDEVAADGNVDNMDDTSSVADTASVAGSIKGKGKARADGNSEPLSFSRIPASALHAQLGLPSGSNAAEDGAGSDVGMGLKSLNPIVVYLKPGEMLYLPASWIHEVSSASLPSPSPAAEAESVSNGKRPRGEGALPDVHMAFNYWFYPPDQETGEGGEGVYKMQPLFDHLGGVIERKWKDDGARDGEKEESGTKGSKRVKVSYCESEPCGLR